MYLIRPEARRLTLLATFTTPVSHHDPATATSANVTTFLRRKMVVEKDAAEIDPDRIQDLVERLPVPEPLAPIFHDLTVPEFLAAAAIRQFLQMHNGQGLLDGKDRYNRLQSRAEFCAIRATSMYSWWGGMVRELQGAAPYRNDAQTVLLLGMPTALAQLVFVELIENAASAIALARMWAEHDGERQQYVALALPPLGETSSQVTVPGPAFSANSARHEIVREPGAIHLLNALDLRFDDLPDMVAAMLYNGGDLSGTAPANAFALKRQICETYPLLALIGGSTKGFILGSSNLEVSAWLVTTEYQKMLEPFGVRPEISAFDLLDRDEQTRHAAGRVDGSPMPYAFETLAAGTQVVIDLRLRPYATPLEVGALAAAVDTYMGADSTLGGQSARGYGLAVADIIQQPETDMQARRQEYEAYLAENKDDLAAGLLDGTLGTGKDLF